MHVKALIAERPDWLEYLSETYKIKASTSGDVVSLKYNQIESPMHEPIVQECRGMVVCTRRKQVLAHPYNKFWNHGEGGAAPIDWSTAMMFDKLDGSLMILYWDEDQALVLVSEDAGDVPDTDGGWTVASSGHPVAGGPYGDSDITYAEAFWRTWNALGMKFPSVASQNICFMFELCAPDNRVVVKYPVPRIVLHGARNMHTGLEAPYHELVAIAETYGWEVVRAHGVASAEDAIAKAEALDPVAHEGFVVVDANFNRIKVKSQRYVALHHMKGEFTDRRAIELWQTGEAKELLAHFPEMAPKILPIHDALDICAGNAVKLFGDHSHVETKKEYAMLVKDSPYSAVAFKMWDEADGSIPDVMFAKSVMRGFSTSTLEKMLAATKAT